MEGDRKLVQTLLERLSARVCALVPHDRIVCCERKSERAARCPIVNTLSPLYSFPIGPETT